MTTSQVDVRVIFYNLAGPVDPVDNRARRGTFRLFAVMIGSGPIGDDKELVRACTRNLAEHPFGLIRTVENNEGYRRAHRSISKGG